MHIDTVSIFFHGVPAVLGSALLLSRSVFESSCTRCGELRNNFCKKVKKHSNVLNKQCTNFKMIPTGGGQKLLIFLALLDVLSAKVGIGHGHDHQGEHPILWETTRFLFFNIFNKYFEIYFAAFIQSESDLRYLVDDGVDVQSFSEVRFFKTF